MRTTGTVKWFNDAKGFGFVTPADGSKDCFVHPIRPTRARASSPWPRAISVEFDIVQGAKGPAAERVSKFAK